MKARFFMVIGALCLVQIAFGQNEIDALRYSKYNLNGTARYVAMGGAFGALGADISSISINPAGLAMYRRSEFGLSLGFTGAKSSSVYENSTANNTNFSAGFGNIGMVGSYPTEDPDLPRVNFAVAYNKTADFNEKISIQGTAENTTLLNVFVNQAHGVSTEDIGTAFPFSASLAWDTYLINPSDTLNSGLYTHEIPWGDVTQTKTIERSGSMGETLLAGGFNYTDDVYIGVSLGFPSLNFTEESTYREGELEEGFELDHFVFRDNMVARGNGFNFKVGGIYKPNDWLRVGAAVHSPNWMTVNESYDRSMTAVFKGEPDYPADSPEGNYQYRIKTPARFITSLAIVGGKFGLISADYELVDYTSTKLRTSNKVFDEYDFGIENQTLLTRKRTKSQMRCRRPASVAVDTGGALLIWNSRSTHFVPDRCRGWRGDPAFSSPHSLCQGPLTSNSWYHMIKYILRSGTSVPGLRHPCFGRTIPIRFADQEFSFSASIIASPIGAFGTK